MKDEKQDKRRGNEFVDHYSSSSSYGRNKRARIRRFNRMTELLGHPDREIEQRILASSFPGQESSKREYLVDCQVRSAVGRLSPAERLFVELFYFEFRSYQEIAGIMNKKTHKLERLHQRALGKLQILLAGFVKEQYKLELPRKTDCTICNSPFREELEGLIRGKNEEETYSRLLRVFRQQYGVNLKTPQAIIGHKKKHMV